MSALCFSSLVWLPGGKKPRKQRSAKACWGSKVWRRRWHCKSSRGGWRRDCDWSKIDHHDQIAGAAYLSSKQPAKADFRSSQIKQDPKGAGSARMLQERLNVSLQPPPPRVLTFTSVIVDIPARSPAQVHNIDHKYVGLVIGKASPWAVGQSYQSISNFKPAESCPMHSRDQRWSPLESSSKLGCNKEKPTDSVNQPARCILKVNLRSGASIEVDQTGRMVIYTGTKKQAPTQHTVVHSTTE